jgi:hypothetical protein
MNKPKMIVGYHFTGEKLRDGRAIPAIGEWLEHDGPVKPCDSGLHASVDPFDALQFAPGNLLHRVELEGDLNSHGNPVDKWVGRRRKITASIDAEKLLREFARWCALQVVHLWECPPVVRQYLDTGDESLRAAACAAASAAAWDAARAAAWADARDAAWAAAWGDAWDDARDAASAAACAAARAAAWDAARADAWADASAAARAAAWADAWADARYAQRAKFNEMVNAAFAAKGEK